MDHVVLHADSAQTLRCRTALPIPSKLASGLFLFFLPDSKQPPSNPQKNNNVYTRSYVCVCVSDVGSSQSTRQPIQLCTLPGLCGCVLCLCCFLSHGRTRPSSDAKTAKAAGESATSVCSSVRSSVCSCRLLFRPARQRDKGTQQLQPRTPTRSSSSSTTTTTTTTTDGASRG